MANRSWKYYYTSWAAFRMAESLRVEAAAYVAAYPWLTEVL